MPPHTPTNVELYQALEHALVSDVEPTPTVLHSYIKGENPSWGVSKKRLRVILRNVLLSDWRRAPSPMHCNALLIVPDPYTAPPAAFQGCVHGLQVEMDADGYPTARVLQELVGGSEKTTHYVDVNLEVGQDVPPCDKRAYCYIYRSMGFEGPVVVVKGRPAYPDGKVVYSSEFSDDDMRYATWWYKRSRP
ncbi:hypothetical protein FA95DRAFT_1608984 [Auriscalpium vulgare]|uniref:Uncharacterized protein n=1 Tax=Auriscalpium vulgare TaxID=40419 RepID=A0ACB8RJE4_9AGAM|nr:hypothetical protein FA95DRAFT_1608984 [Auriscalpium vulgare]